MEVASFLVTIFIILVTKCIVNCIINELECAKKWDSCELPGPSIGYSFIGQLWGLMKFYKKPMVLYTNWSQEYGGIYKVKIGSKLLIVLSSPEWFNKVLAKTGTKLSYRVRDNVLSSIIGNKGIVTSDGDVWKEHRKFTLKAFRDLEVGKESTHHEIIFKQVNCLVEHIHCQISKTNVKGLSDGYDAQVDIGVGLFNILWHFVGGHTFSFDSTTIREIVVNTKTEMKASEMGGPWNFSILLGIIWIVLCNPIKLLTSFLKRRSFVLSEIALRRIHGSIQNLCNTSMVDKYLEQIERMKELKRKSAEFPYPLLLADDQLGGFASDLVVAGVETTYSSVRWALLFLAANPHYMRVLQKELDDKLKLYTLYELTSFHKCGKELPFLEGVVAETLRIRPVIHTICHTAIEDIILESFKIPKGTWVMGNIWGLHHNNIVWEDPERFRPERFLNDSLSEVSKPQLEKCLVFSTGSRKCVGESLSRVELYAFLVALCSNFDVSILGSSCDLEPQVGISLIPPDCKLVFKKRDR